MKKSEFKEYLKTEILNMQEATEKEVELQKDLNAELEKTKELTKNMQENKVTKSQFKEYLRNEILREIEEEDEELKIDDVDDTLDEPSVDMDTPELASSDELDDISDTLVDLARKAKNSGEIELANQILNSAKYAAKTQFKDVEGK